MKLRLRLISRRKTLLLNRNLIKTSMMQKYNIISKDGLTITNKTCKATQQILFCNNL